jgi:hypothetical protein
MARRRRHRGNNGPGDLPIDPTAIVSDPNFRPVDPAKARIGWRAWRVDRELPKYGLPPKLYSASFPYHWRPKQKAEADCPGCGQPDGVGVPGEHCSCGFYSAKSLKHLLSMGYHQYTADGPSFTVVGKIGCWGKIVEGTQGWRAQYAYPIELLVPYEAGFDFAKRLRDTYGCKVRLMNFLIQPDEVTDEIVEALANGKPLPVRDKKVKNTGRRVTHKLTKFDGRVTGEAYDIQKDGRTVRVIDVAWDVQPDKSVTCEVANLAMHATR